MGCECDAVEVGGRREREAGGSNSCPIGIRWLMSGDDGGSVVAGPTRRSVCVPLPSHSGLTPTLLLALGTGLAHRRVKKTKRGRKI